MRNYVNKTRVLGISAFILASVVLFGHNASALTLSPARIEIGGNPGEIIESEMTLINEGRNTDTYYSSFASFEAQGESGDPAFVESRDGLDTWMSVGSSVTLNPGEGRSIPFSISIPKDADPGGHFATIFWGTSPHTPGQIAVGAKTGILILLSVYGDVEENAGLLNFNTVNKQFFYSTLPVTFEYRFRNDGGDRIKPTGKITIRNTVFLPTETLDANPGNGNILPGSTRKFNVTWQNYKYPNEYVPSSSFFKKFWSDVSYQWKNFAVGLYSARLNVAYGASDERAKDMVFFFVFPWQLVLVILVITVIIFFGGKNLIRRYNAFIINRAARISAKQ